MRPASSDTSFLKGDADRAEMERREGLKRRSGLWALGRGRGLARYDTLNEDLVRGVRSGSRNKKPEFADPPNRE